MQKITLRGMIQLQSSTPQTRENLEKLQAILMKARDVNKQVELMIKGFKCIVNPVHVIGPGKSEYKQQPDGHCKITFYAEEELETQEVKQG